MSLTLDRFDCAAVVREMRASDDVRYVGFTSNQTLTYKEQMVSRYSLPLAARRGARGLLLPLLYWYDRTHIPNPTLALTLTLTLTPTLPTGH